MNINKTIHNSTYQSQCEAVINETSCLSGWTFIDYEFDMRASGFVIMNLRNPKNEKISIRLFGVQANWKKAIKEALIEHEPSLVDYLFLN